MEQDLIRIKYELYFKYSLRIFNNLHKLVLIMTVKKIIETRKHLFAT
jgi:hypothetical protein